MPSSSAVAHIGSYSGESYGISSMGDRGNHGPDQPHVGASLQLVYPFLDIVHVDHGYAFDTFGVRLAELGQPVVICPAYRAERRSLSGTAYQKRAAVG